MPFPIPARSDLQQQILADLQARTGIAKLFRRSTLKVLAYLWAGSLWLVYRFIAWLAKQLFIDSAETTYLERRLAAYGIVREGATYAAGNFIYVGTPTIPIPIGSGLQNDDNSVRYVTQTAVEIGGGGTVTVAIVATVAGSAGNADAGASLSLSTAIAGVQPTGTVDSGGLTGGTDAETDDALRARGEARIQQPPQGGAATDYIAWAKLVPGVTRVWVYPLNRGAGTVDLIFVMDGRTSNIPLTADITNVQASIDTYRPVTADAQAFAPTGDALTITVANLVPNTTAMQNAITDKLTALALTVPAGSATIGDGVTPTTPGGTLLLESIYAAINQAGPTGYDLTAPTADVTFAKEHIPGTWTVTF